MAKALTSLASNAITNKRINYKYICKIGGIDYSSYVRSYEINADRQFGAMSAIVILDNSSGIFDNNGSANLQVADIVEIQELFKNDTITYNRFYGFIDQRSISKTSNSKDNSDLELKVAI